MSRVAIPEREPFVYRVLRAWARGAISVFGRRCEVTRIDRVPVDRPAILASNHVNGLADIAAIVNVVPKFPHFLASATWWKVTPARWLLNLGGAVPIHRRRDSDTEQNTSTFEACNEALATGAHIVIFPEGEMHREPSLMPMKTGTARIALGAADAGVRGVSIVPLGLVYDAPTRFRSIGEMHFEEPIEVDEWVDVYRDDPAKAVREMTDLLAERLAAATVNNRSREEGELLDRAAALALADGVTRPEDLPYARRNVLRRALARALAPADSEARREYRELAATVEAHGRDLARLGITDPNAVPALTGPLPGEQSRLQFVLVALAPPGIVGLLGNAPTIVLAQLAGRRANDELWQATYKGMAASLLSPIVWTTELVFLSRRVGRRRAFALVTTSAVGALASIAWWERFVRWRRIRWVERAEQEHPADLAAAQLSRSEVRARVETLVAEPRRTASG